MYIPEQFTETNLPTLHEFMRQHSFATVVTQQGSRPYSSHLPLILDNSVGSQGTLIGHMARNNPQWQDFASGAEILVMFHGPHAYVSPAWYEAKNMVVPTWNYMAVHAYGIARIQSEEILERTLHRLVGVHEKAFQQPWVLEITQPMRERMLSAIVGFEITLTSVEGKFKLSQNRPLTDQRKVIAKLSESTGINNSKSIANQMSLRLKEE